MMDERERDLLHKLGAGELEYSIAFDWIQTLRKTVFNLETENARLREAMRWIPVEEKLPGIYQRVLCCHGGRSYTATFGMVGGKPYFEVWEGRAYPTHWMPIPEFKKDEP